MLYTIDQTKYFLILLIYYFSPKPYYSPLLQFLDIFSNSMINCYLPLKNPYLSSFNIPFYSFYFLFLTNSDPFPHYPFNVFLEIISPETGVPSTIIWSRGKFSNTRTPVSYKENQVIPLLRKIYLRASILKTHHPPSANKTLISLNPVI
jgi:hypothetical protein